MVVGTRSQGEHGVHIQPPVRSIWESRLLGGAINLKMCGRDPTLLLHLMFQVHCLASLSSWFGNCHHSKTRKNCKEFALFAARLALAGFSVVINHIVETGPLNVLVRQAAAQTSPCITVFRGELGHQATWRSLVLRALLLPAAVGSDRDFW